MTNRVTQEHLESLIVHEAYFTAGEGVAGAQLVDVYDDEHTFLADCAKYAMDTLINAPESLSRLTFCVLTLKNGFTVTGESACVSAENFDAEIGRKIARKDALDKMWPLEGYLLAQRRYDKEW